MASEQSSWPVIDSGSCPCGAIRIETIADPIFVANCHCSVCRRFCNKPYNAFGMFWKKAVTISWTNSKSYDDDMLEYEQTDMLRRARCSKCKAPVGDIGIGLLKPFTFLVAAPLGLRPSLNIFYGSGEKNGTLGLRTFYSDFESNLFLIPIILLKGVPQRIMLWLRGLW